jgi:vancomycin resistance protein YoaR
LEITPDVTTEMVENITYKLAEFSTAFNPNNEARTHNIRNACKKIDQSLLLPQQEFSMDKALGDRTVQNGYKQAKVIVNNEYVDGLGGGICQVTSTVYNTVLLSGLEVLERRNHTLPASYIGVGRDATISQGYIDLKFKNTSEYSVLIEAKTVENKIVVVLWGLEPKEQTRFKIRTKIVQTIEPEGIEIVIDPSLKEGEAEVLREAKPGYKVEVYRDRLDKFGNIIETEKISVDSYLPQKMKIRAGE